MFNKKYLFIAVCIGVGLCLVGLSAEAVTLPNFAQGGPDIKAASESTGKNIVDAILALIAVAAIISIAVGILQLTVTKGENAKLYIFSGLGGLFGSGVIYGIARLVA